MIAPDDQDRLITLDHADALDVLRWLPPVDASVTGDTNAEGRGAAMSACLCR